MPDRWERMSLEDLRLDALGQVSGIAYEAVREVQSLQRLFMVVCVTDEDQVERICGALKIEDDGMRENWRELSLMEVVSRASRSPNGLVFELSGLRAGVAGALALISAVPDSTRKLERLFGF